MRSVVRYWSIALVSLAVCLAALQKSECLLGHLKKCNANYTIAGVFAMHNKIEQGKHICAKESGQLVSGGVYEALALVFAALNVNSNEKLLPGVPITVEIQDNCNSVHIALERYLGLDFVSKINKNSRSQRAWPGQIFSVIGSTTTAMARSMATLANVYDMPLISHVASSPVLSNDNLFPSFFRTVPSDRLLIEALIEFLYASKWQLVSVVYTSTDYAVSAFELFLSKIKEKDRKVQRNICIVGQHRIHNSENITELGNLLDRMKNETESKVNVIFAHKRDSHKFLLHAFEKNFTEMVWILSEGIDGTDGKKCRDIAKKSTNNVISIGFKEEINQQYKKFIKECFSDPSSSKLLEILPLTEVEWNATFQSNNSRHRIPVSVAYVIDAVMAAVHALHKALNCSEKACRSEVVHQSAVLKNLQQVNFTSQFGRPMTFDKFGDTNGTYVFEVLSFDPGHRCRFYELAEWQSSGSPKGFIKFNNSMTKKTVSKCPEKCQRGWGWRMERQKNKCCWPCKKCIGNEYSSSITGMCEQCSEREAPDYFNAKCVLLKRFQNTIAGNAFNVAVVCLSVIGLFLVVFVSITFLRHRQSHIVRASNKEATAFLLLGIALGYAIPLVATAQRTTFTCRFYLYVNGLSIGLMTGSLFTKANRMYRIFRKQAMTEGQLRFMGIKWQLLIISLFVATEMLLTTVLVYNPKKPVSVKEIISKSQRKINIVCDSDIDFWKFLLLFLLAQCLYLICTYQAFLARKVPGEYNDSKSMFGATMVMSLENIIFLSMSYYGGLKSNTAILTSLPGFLNATIVLTCLFGCKMYVILFKPSLNAVALPHGNLGTFETPPVTLKTFNRQLQHAGIRNMAFQEDVL